MRHPEISYLLLFFPLKDWKTGIYSQELGYHLFPLITEVSTGNRQGRWKVWGAQPGSYSLPPYIWGHRLKTRKSNRGMTLGLGFSLLVVTASSSLLSSPTSVLVKHMPSGIQGASAHCHHHRPGLSFFLIEDLYTWLTLFPATSCSFLLPWMSPDLLSHFTPTLPPTPRSHTGITLWSTMRHTSSKPLFSPPPPLQSSQYIDFTILPPKIAQVTSDLPVQWPVPYFFSLQYLPPVLTSLIT